MIDTRHFGLLRPRDARDVDLHMTDVDRQRDDRAMPTEMQVVTADGSDGVAVLLLQPGAG